MARVVLIAAPGTRRSLNRISFHRGKAKFARAFSPVRHDAVNTEEEEEVLAWVDWHVPWMVEALPLLQE